MDNLSVLENGITFKDIEEKIYKTVSYVACTTMEKELDHLYRRLMEVKY